MNRALTVFMLLVVGPSLFSQSVKACKTKFTPHSVTYNASPKPSECWEAVANGINIQTETVEGFFALPFKDTDALKEKIGDLEVIIAVRYFEKPDDGSGVVGTVVKIVLKSEVIYEEK